MSDILVGIRTLLQGEEVELTDALGLLTYAHDEIAQLRGKAVGRDSSVLVLSAEHTQGFAPLQDSVVLSFPEDALERLEGCTTRDQVLDLAERVDADLYCEGETELAILKHIGVEITDEIKAKLAKRFLCRVCWATFDMPNFEPAPR